MAKWSAVRAAAVLVRGYLAALRQHLQAFRARDVTVDADWFWGSDWSISVPIELHNRSNDAFRVTRAEVCRPRRALLHPWPWSGQAPATSQIELSVRLPPPGAGPGHEAASMDAGPPHLTLTVQPPPGWSGGNLRIRLVLEPETDPARQRSILINRLVI